jgi:hypothetical protein
LTLATRVCPGFAIGPESRSSATPYLRTGAQRLSALDRSGFSAGE